MILIQGHESRAMIFKNNYNQSPCACHAPLLCHGRHSLPATVIMNSCSMSINTKCYCKPGRGGTNRHQTSGTREPARQEAKHGSAWPSRGQSCGVIMWKFKIGQEKKGIHTWSVSIGSAPADPTADAGECLPRAMRGCFSANGGHLPAGNLQQRGLPEMGSTRDD